VVSLPFPWHRGQQSCPRCLQHVCPCPCRLATECLAAVTSLTRVHKNLFSSCPFLVGQYCTRPPSHCCLYVPKNCLLPAMHLTNRYCPIRRCHYQWAAESSRSQSAPDPTLLPNRYCPMRRCGRFRAPCPACWYCVGVYLLAFSSLYRAGPLLPLLHHPHRPQLQIRRSGDSGLPNFPNPQGKRQ
jgi:hypothetical protein